METESVEHIQSFQVIHLDIWKYSPEAGLTFATGLLKTIICDQTGGLPIGGISTFDLGSDRYLGVKRLQPAIRETAF